MYRFSVGFVLVKEWRALLQPLMFVLSFDFIRNGFFIAVLHSPCILKSAAQKLLKWCDVVSVSIQVRFLFAYALPQPLVLNFNFNGDASVVILGEYISTPSPANTSSCTHC